jgi:hypothetical protein
MAEEKYSEDVPEGNYSGRGHHSIPEGCRGERVGVPLDRKALCRYRPEPPRSRSVFKQTKGLDALRLPKSISDLVD